MQPGPVAEASRFLFPSILYCDFVINDANQWFAATRGGLSWMKTGGWRREDRTFNSLPRY